ncbi:MAG TPA: hypothetical protein VEM58_05405 [Streptosporangiaceae bacterium]|nr:hypothetical protein [Streptosporangiaceae bacterium]
MIHRLRTTISAVAVAILPAFGAAAGPAQAAGGGQIARSGQATWTAGAAGGATVSRGAGATVSRGAGASVSRGAGASGPGAAKPPGRAGAPAGAAGPGRLASPPAVPGLSIAVTDGRNLARPGDRLAYAVRVDDTGAVSVRRLRVTLTLTSALTIISVSGHGTARAGTVTWTGGLRAGRSASFAVTARVGRIPAGLARLPAVACATPGRHGSVVCAARARHRRRSCSPDTTPAGCSARPG